MVAAAAAELLHYALDNLPQAVLLAVALAVLVLFAKDAAAGLRAPFLSPDAWRALALVERVALTHNTRRLRFALPHADQLLGLPVGRHVSLKAALPVGGAVIRPYTPTSDGLRTRGHVDFVVKIYPDGKMSAALEALPLGGALLFKGPRGRFDYAPRRWRALGMVAGGTGITPMFQVAQEVLRDANDPTRVALVFANVSEGDILLRAELDDWARRFPDRFSVRYVLNEPAAGWAGGVGFVTPEELRAALPAPGPGVAVLRCGPPGMMRALEGHFAALGYAEDAQFQF
jgi:cytochrome-b5 reductase